MAIRKYVGKYEPMVGADYVGNDGDIWVDLETNELHISDEQNPGGRTIPVTERNGVTDMGGGLWVGNLKDNDSVVWASEDAEYVGLWWAGNRNLEGPGYGPSAALTVGHDVTDDMQVAPPGTTVAVNIGEDYQWKFNGDDGSFHSARNITIDGSEGQFLARQSGGGAHGGYSFVYDGGYDTGMFSPSDGLLEFYNNASLTLKTQRVSNYGKATIYGVLTLPPQSAQPTGEPGMLAVCDGSSWNGGGDGAQHLMVYINGGWTKVV